MTAKIINQNQSKNDRFLLQAHKFPDVEFHCTSVTLPGLSLAASRGTTPFTDRPLPGDKISFASLPVTFIVSEDFENYYELQEWFRQVGFPESHAEFRELKDDYKNVYSDMTISLLSNNLNQRIRVDIFDAVPTDLGGLDFTSTSSTAEPLTCDVTFEYAYYKLTKEATSG